MSPTYTCFHCGAWVVVQPDGRGHPPDIARRKLILRCRASGHEAIPVYRAGMA